MFDKFKVPAISLAVVLAMSAVGCGKKPPAPVPPPPPPQQQPTADTTTRPTTPTPPAAVPVIAQFTAEPTNIQIGQSSTLRWQVNGDATGVSIDQTIGTVQNTGSRRVFPSQPTTYTLTATGSGGSTTATVTVNVTEVPPPPTVRAPVSPTGGTATLGTIIGSLQDVFFDYDQSEVRSDQQSVLQQDAAVLKSLFAGFPNVTISIEGHCDERGSAEYNLGLGDRRASSVKGYLQQLGVPADRMSTISYGKERPQCTDADEACYQKNRRAHFSAGQ
jgi:peptidoglycan-associated lipoprotein